MSSNVAVNYDNYPVGQEIVVMSRKQIPPETEWIPAKEAAAIMNVAVSNVRYLCAEKRIRCQKFGRMWQVSKQDAEDYVRSNRNPEWLHEDDKNS